MTIAAAELRTSLQQALSNRIFSERESQRIVAQIRAQGGLDAQGAQTVVDTLRDAMANDSLRLDEPTRRRNLESFLSTLNEMAPLPLARGDGGSFTEGLRLSLGTSDPERLQRPGQLHGQAFREQAESFLNEKELAEANARFGGDGWELPVEASPMAQGLYSLLKRGDQESLESYYRPQIQALFKESRELAKKGTPEAKARAQQLRQEAGELQGLIDSGAPLAQVRRDLMESVSTKDAMAIYLNSPAQLSREKRQAIEQSARQAGITFEQQFATLHQKSLDEGAKLVEGMHDALGKLEQSGNKQDAALADVLRRRIRGDLDDAGVMANVSKLMYGAGAGTAVGAFLNGRGVAGAVGIGAGTVAGAAIGQAMGISPLASVQGAMDALQSELSFTPAPPLTAQQNLMLDSKSQVALEKYERARKRYHDKFDSIHNQVMSLLDSGFPIEYVIAAVMSLWSELQEERLKLKMAKAHAARVLQKAKDDEVSDREKALLENEATRAVLLGPDGMKKLNSAAETPLAQDELRGLYQQRREKIGDLASAARSSEGAFEAWKAELSEKLSPEELGALQANIEGKALPADQARTEWIDRGKEKLFAQAELEARQVGRMPQGDEEKEWRLRNLAESSYKAKREEAIDKLAESRGLDDPRAIQHELNQEMARSKALSDLVAGILAILRAMEARAAGAAA